MTIRPFLILLILGVLLAACGAAASPAAPPASSSTTAVPTLPPGAPYLQITFSGGRCTYGLCSRTASFAQDGALTITDGAGTTKDAHLAPAELTELVTQIDRADLAAVTSRPFTGTCPSAYDGQEITFTFSTAATSEVIPGCTYAIDAAAAPFSTALALLAKYDI
jgi:hypothetical protein